MPHFVDVQRCEGARRSYDPLMDDVKVLDATGYLATITLNKALIAHALGTIPRYHVHVAKKKMESLLL